LKTDNFGSEKNGTDAARLAAAEIVYMVLENRSFSNLSFESAFEGKSLTGLDRSFATAIAYGTLTRIVNVDAILMSKSSVLINKLDPYVRSILRTAIWQIYWSEQIPDYAVCNESVKIAKMYSNAGGVSYVNAILRTLVNQKESIDKEFVTEPKAFYLKCSMPPELAGYFKKWFGEKRAVEICNSLNISSGISIRVNILKSDDDLVLTELDMQGCNIEPSSFSPHSFIIRTNGIPIESLSVFKAGDFSVQDESAMLVSLLADPRPGSVIADVCSAPGGKSCHMAELMGNNGTIYAFDINLSRLRLIEENAKRLGITIIKTMQADASKAIELKECDIVLADVPCSGLGIMRKKPEIRINMTHEKITGLHDLQRDILANAATLVKPGGVLIYSTCTLNPKENEERVMEFLQTTGSEFELEDFSSLIPLRLKEIDPQISESACKGMITLFPDMHGSDGFFIAKMRSVV
jgi:16S rRNA (cytosine967-C5)-methyltransferase